MLKEFHESAFVNSSYHLQIICPQLENILLDDNEFPTHLKHVNFITDNNFNYKELQKCKFGKEKL